MSDLEINIALAKAMGWDELNPLEWIKTSKTGFIADGVVLCSYQGYGYSKELDYRDPVIFVAICKRWKLVVYHSDTLNPLALVHVWNNASSLFQDLSVEKAAALAVIDAAKRGVK